MIKSSRIPPAKRSIIAAAFLFAFTFIIYTPTLITAEFVWDDTWYVIRNESLRSWAMAPLYFTDVSTMAGERLMPLFRPLRNLTYALDYSLWGLNPAGWHLHNIAWHAACVVLVFFLARRISGRGDGAALAAALIFCVHPAVVESVAWVKSRDSLMSGAFAFAACLLFLRARRQRVGVAWAAGVAGLFALSLYSYLISLGAMVATAAMVALLPGEGWRRNRRALLALAIVSAAVSMGFIIHRWAVIGRMSQTEYLVQGSAFWTMITMLPAAVTYLRLMVFPMTLNADYFNYPHYTTLGSPIVIGAALLLLSLLGASVWLWRRGQPLPLLAGVWVAAFLFPVSNVVPTMQILAERFLYLPVFAVALLVGHYWAVGYDRVAGRWRRAWGAGLLIVLTALLIRTEARLLDWTNEYALYESTWLADPENCRALMNFGVAKFNNEEWEDAVILLERQRAQCRSEVDVFRCLGFSYARTGRPDQAIAALDEGIRQYPGESQLMVYKALIASEAGRRDVALDALLTIQPRITDWDLRFLLAVAWQNLGELDEARLQFTALLPARPDDVNLRLNLGRVNARLGDRLAAREHYAHALRLRPDLEEARRMIEELGEAAPRD